MLLTCGVGEDSWESLGLQGDQICPEYSLEGLMLKLKLQYFGYLMQRTDSLEKTLMLGKIESRRRTGWQRMRWLDGITDLMDMDIGGGQGSLAYCSPWGHKESDTTEWLNWTETLDFLCNFSIIKYQWWLKNWTVLCPPDAKNWLIGKDPDPGKDWRWEKGMTKDEVVGLSQWT